MAVYVSRNTLDGDKYAEGLLKKFFTEFVQEFYTDERTRDQLIENLFALEVSDIQKYKGTLILGDCSVIYLEDIDDLLKSVSEFTRTWLSTNSDYRVTFEDHYKEEWLGSVLGEKGSYTVAQYNAMLLNTTFRTLIMNFVRQQMYEYYEKALHNSMEREGVSCYVTAIASIDKYGLYDPNPVFIRKSGPDGVRKLSTAQPDIANIWEYLQKYKIVEFVEGTDEYEGYMVARYSGICNPEAMLENLNTLKYKHLCIGKTARRQILNIQNQQVEYLEELDSVKVTGNGRYWR